MNMWNNVINAWWPLVFYPATDAPRFTKGMWAMIGTAIATLGVTALVYVLERREKGRIEPLAENDSREDFKEQKDGELEGGIRKYDSMQQ
ncbi:hypothetical protein PHLCEN_2v12325 [Hermanssonia centrifuga]|uniref:Uncharacterized protein n=1 Tax=Hermanssonia centrifuga TaxID=98765 RepID=A0A2R6NHG7_9APHY|nr:hypothetical protein PHLCEN_2v12325 [Hermanssonia centrifuga]